MNLNELRDAGEQLRSDLDGSEEGGFSSFVDRVATGVVPIEVHERLLQTQQVVDRADDDVHGRCVACLTAQVVLEVWRKNTKYM